MLDLLLYGALALLAGVTFWLAPRAIDADGFFKGWSRGTPPGLLTLTFSQVTTWIFARSLLTAAILGYYYGIAGGLAYTAYYLSFLTGGAIVRSIRFRHGFESVHTFLADRFGRGGTACYNFVIGLRLLSEVFANLLVIGLIFDETGSLYYMAAIVSLAAVTLAYSMMGGLQASLRTDVFQMSAFFVVFAVVLSALFTQDMFSAGAIFASSPDPAGPGWVLLCVAALQVWSYPLHDPVMMDRGFIADRDTTRRSFRHAAWISMFCILGFSLLGVYAGLNSLDGETLQSSLERLLGGPTMVFLNLALIISAVSTLDSTLSSSAKLACADMKVFPANVRNGRIVMALFMLGGLAFVLGDTKDLYAAVAVSGTASMYLAPVIFFSIWRGAARVETWAYYVSFAAAIAGAALYYTEAGAITNILTPLTGIEHKYAKLLLISVAVLVIGNAAFALAGGLGRKADSVVRR